MNNTLLTPRVLVSVLVFFGFFGAGAIGAMVSVDYEKLISSCDLTYTRAVSCSEEGMPVGNGRMGSTVWTQPAKLKFQINRVDVFATNSYTDSLQENENYFGGCGFVDVDFGGEVFPAENTLQHLAAYKGLLTIEGNGVKVQVFAWHEKDVMVIHVDDQRGEPANISVDLTMLRPAVVKTRNHTATSNTGVQEGRISLVQQFSEHDYLCRTAVVIGAAGREVNARSVNETTVQLTAEAGKGPLTILIASAATFDRGQDVDAQAMAQLNSAKQLSFAELLEDNQAWWREFWSKSFVCLHSEDGQADMVQSYYNWHLYLMGSSSRGKYPVKFNGLLWLTNGDKQRWGGPYWWFNTESTYCGLFASNHLELMQPMFDMYSGMYEAAALAARQQWRAEGIFIPETVAFNGPERLPQEIAEELSALLLREKAWKDMSPAMYEYQQYRNAKESRWNWKRQYPKTADFIVKLSGTSDMLPFSATGFIFYSQAQIAWHYYRYYEYTLDEQWLRERAYPMIRGVSEFYRTFPNVKKGADGKYHIHDVNCGEPVWGAQDTHEELVAMHGILPLAIQVSERLNVDADKRVLWQEFFDNLAPLPTNDNPQASLPRQPGRPLMWAEALKPAGWIKDPYYMELRIPTHYDLISLETPPSQFTELTHATYKAHNWGGWAYNKMWILPDMVGKDPKGVFWMSWSGVRAANLGYADDVKEIVPRLVTRKGRDPKEILPNRMTMEGGPQSVEHLGKGAETIQSALCQNKPASLGGDPVIRVFPAWPKGWDAQFSLLRRHGFMVSSAIAGGNISFVEIVSQLGGTCRIRNPWQDTEVTLYRNDVQSEDIQGSLLRFNTSIGELIVMVPKGVSPASLRVKIP